jgi:hypothetical protein
LVLRVRFYWSRLLHAHDWRYIPWMDSGDLDDSTTASTHSSLVTNRAKEILVHNL